MRFIIRNLDLRFLCKARYTTCKLNFTVSKSICWYQKVKCRDESAECDGCLHSCRDHKQNIYHNIGNNFCVSHTHACNFENICKVNKSQYNLFGEREKRATWTDNTRNSQIKLWIKNTRLLFWNHKRLFNSFPKHQFSAWSKGYLSFSALILEN